MSRLVLDAGAFVAFERGDARIRARFAAARRLEVDLVTTSPVVGQIWRNGRKQALVARLLAGTEVDAPDEAQARRAGELLARAKRTDVVDALLATLARPGDAVVTSDPGDVEGLLAAAGAQGRVTVIRT